MISLKLLLIENIRYVPGVFYHATYLPLMKSIKDNGIVPGGIKYQNYPDFDPKLGVYLAEDDDLAGGLVWDATSDKVPLGWKKKIIILSINPKVLDLNKLEYDPNMSYTEHESNDKGMSKSYVYKGVIPVSAIIDAKRGSYQW